MNIQISFISCFFPEKARLLCTKLKAKLVVIGLVIIAVVVFVNTTLMFGLTAIGDTQICSPLQVFFTSYQILTKVDIFVNIVLPYGAIIVLVTLLSVRLLLASDVRDTSHDASYTEVTSPDVSDVREAGCSMRRRCIKLDVHGWRCYGPVTDTGRIAATIMLSVSVLCLNLPCHALRTSFAVRELLNLHYYIKFEEYLMQQIFQYPFHASFAVKPFLCLIFWKSYRLSLIAQVKSLHARLVRCCCGFDKKNERSESEAPVELSEIRRNNNEMNHSPSKSKSNGRAEWV